MELLANAIRAVGVSESIVGIKVKRPFEIIETENDEEGFPIKEVNRIVIPAGIFNITSCCIGGGSAVTHYYIREIDCSEEEMPLLSTKDLMDFNSKGTLEIIEQ